MNLLRIAEFKVGALVLVVGGLIAYASMKVSDDPTQFSRSQKAWFLMKDAGGLVKNSAVKMAGIPVGTITSITLQDGQARIDITVKTEIPLYTSAAIEIKSQGILGDQHVEIYPGSPTDPPLGLNGQILNIKDKGSLDSVISQVGDIASSLKAVAKTLEEATTKDGTRDHVLGRIVLNIEKITQDLSEVTAQNKGKINHIVDQVSKISDSINDLLNDETNGGIKKQLKEAVARLDSTMKNVDEIAGKINRGEGTIGKLVNDDETVDNLNQAIDGVNGFLDTAGKTQTSVEFHAEYLNDLAATKSSVGIRLQPGVDRYYYLGIVDNPAGYVDTQQISNTTGGYNQNSTVTTVYKNRVEFTVLFVKNFYDLAIKAGLIESSGGFGFDYYLYHKKLKLSVDFYNLATMNIQPQIQYSFWKGIYATAGYMDLLNKNQQKSSYIGAGILLTNDDVKLLLTKLPL